MGLQEWLLKNLSYRSDISFGASWPENMAIICWNVWRWKCEDLFEERRPSIDHKVGFVHMNIADMERAFDFCSAQHRGLRNNVV